MKRAATTLEKRAKAPRSGASSELPSLQALLSRRYGVPEDQLTSGVKDGLNWVAAGESPAQAMPRLTPPEQSAFLQGLRAVKLSERQVSALLRGHPAESEVILRDLCEKYPVAVAGVFKEWMHAPPIDIEEAMGWVFRYGLRWLDDDFKDRYVNLHLGAALQNLENWGELAQRGHVTPESWEAAIKGSPKHAAGLLLEAMRCQPYRWQGPTQDGYAQGIVHAILGQNKWSLDAVHWTLGAKLTFVLKFMEDDRGRVVTLIPYRLLDQLRQQITQPEELCRWAEVIYALEGTPGSVKTSIPFASMPNIEQVVLGFLFPPEDELDLFIDRRHLRFPSIPLCVGIQGYSMLRPELGIEYLKFLTLSPQNVAAGHLFPRDKLRWITQYAPQDFKDMIKMGASHHGLFLFITMLTRGQDLRIQATGFAQFNPIEVMKLFAFL